jgi:hypothetical protein
VQRQLLVGGADAAAVHHRVALRLLAEDLPDPILWRVHRRSLPRRSGRCALGRSRRRVVDEQVVTLITMSPPGALNGALLPGNRPWAGQIATIWPFLDRYHHWLVNSIVSPSEA